MSTHSFSDLVNVIGRERALEAFAKRYGAKWLSRLSADEVRVVLRRSSQRERSRLFKQLSVTDAGFDHLVLWHSYLPVNSSLRVDVVRLAIEQIGTYEQALKVFGWRGLSDEQRETVRVKLLELIGTPQQYKDSNRHASADERLQVLRRLMRAESDYSLIEMLDLYRMGKHLLPDDTTLEDQIFAAATTFKDRAVVHIAAGEMLDELLADRAWEAMVGMRVTRRWIDLAQDPRLRNERVVCKALEVCPTFVEALDVWRSQPRMLQTAAAYEILSQKAVTFDDLTRLSVLEGAPAGNRERSLLRMTKLATHFNEWLAIMNRSNQPGSSRLATAGMKRTATTPQQQMTIALRGYMSPEERAELRRSCLEQVTSLNEWIELVQLLNPSDLTDEMMAALAKPLAAVASKNELISLSISLFSRANDVTFLVLGPLCETDQERESLAAHMSRFPSSHTAPGVLKGLLDQTQGIDAFWQLVRDDNGSHLRKVFRAHPDVFNAWLCQCTSYRQWYDLMKIGWDVQPSESALAHLGTLAVDEYILTNELIGATPPWAKGVREDTVRIFAFGKWLDLAKGDVAKLQLMAQASCKSDVHMERLEELITQSEATFERWNVIYVSGAGIFYLFTSLLMKKLFASASTWDEYATVYRYAQALVIPRMIDQVQAKLVEMTSLDEAEE